MLNHHKSKLLAVRRHMLCQDQWNLFHNKERHKNNATEDLYILYQMFTLMPCDLQRKNKSTLVDSLVLLVNVCAYSDVLFIPKNLTHFGKNIHPNIFIVILLNVVKNPTPLVVLCTCTKISRPKSQTQNINAIENIC